MLEPLQCHIKVEFGGLIMADSTQGYRFLEAGRPPVYYFPPVDVRRAYFFFSSKQTVCKWRGVARYWTLRIGKRVALNAACSYANPMKEYEVIRDYFAFYPSKVDACYVGREKVKAQPSGFFGGWITSKILGPCKGEIGTEF